ncbi:MAG: hypothetical protein M3173_05800 [Chloroflexota bacterium]|nr:hypothetical protein [Chloroflexota bacterium]
MPDKRREEEQLPPIPDGGLAESMPEWLRRPPAWRTLPDAEVEHGKPAEADELPEADTSPIDPRTFLTDDDLPDWLRRFGPVSPLALSSQPRDGSGERGGGQAEKRTESEQAAEISRSTASARFVPRSPAVNRPAGDRRQSERPAMTRSTQRPTVIHRAAWWQGPQLAILLGVALLVALIVIAILLI